MPAAPDTIVAVSSPPGRSPRAIVRMTGPMSFELARTVFRAREAGRPELSSYWVEDGVVRVEPGPLRPGFELPARLYGMPGPRSYTREDVAELHVLGAPPVVRAVLDRLVRAGARPAEPGEFTRRAYLAGRIDLAQAEAVAKLIHAADEREFRAAARELEGSLGRATRAVAEELRDLAADLEAEIDFADDEVEPSDPGPLAARVATALDALRGLVASSAEPGPQAAGVRAVLVGRPNVGKSSIFNRLVGRSAALVHRTPGSTRDFLDAEIALDGVGFVLYDTAGLGWAAGVLARAAGEARRRAADRADVTVLVVEVGREPAADELQCWAAAGRGPRRLCPGGCCQ